ncbi:PREDICTED: vinorine synthase-like [Camelina sativa]|uniref:Vinorine synthase-like n=1 Tax=Camelina sativa TaxID=90675 RepID=A0ABM0ZDH8_CAMSA|nr:PREDICTED: vinorine synthase-like [Camelina sativa]
MTLARFISRRFHQNSSMIVDVVSRDIIKPSSPTPNHLKKFKLSLLEQLGPTIFGPMVYFYSGNNNRIKPTEQLQKLKKSLSETLTHFYPLAGRLKGNVSIDCNDSGADFLEAEVNSPLSSLLQEPSSDNLQRLIPTSVDSIETRTKLLLAQASFFECGSMAIGVCISHKFADATSIGLFMKTWAAISSRGSIKTVGSPVFDTVKIFPPGNFSETSPAPVIEPEIMMNQTLSNRFVFDSSSIQSLQANASSFEVKQPTRVEAVSALIWKTAMKATRTVSGTSKPSILANSASLRSRVSPPFTENSVGNLVSYFAAKAEEGVNQTKLQTLVSELRKEKQRFRDNHVPKLVGNPSATEIICSYQREAGHMIASGDFDFYIFSSACRFGLYETDFGWGKPAWVGIPCVRQKNIVTLLDTKEAGGIEAWVNLNEQEMKLLEQDSELLHFVSLNPSVIQPFLHVL